MKEIQVTQYEAWDGTRFDSAAKAREYEGKAIHQRLANIAAEKIEAALNGDDPDLADAYERFGLMLRNARRQRGETKWPEARQKAQAAINSEPVRESAA